MADPERPVTIAAGVADEYLRHVPFLAPHHDGRRTPQPYDDCGPGGTQPRCRDWERGRPARIFLPQERAGGTPAVPARALPYLHFWLTTTLRSPGSTPTGPVEPERSTPQIAASLVP